ncbi:FAD-dependent oxidoreductase [Nocardioides marmorisolisilvae]|uniref:ferredoxin--NADP(+) reductase n=1 Tax=Nocardioides marmorisolisilvae TaxID=1542737 RepID=A0A3N0DU78_9ACTN|nr:FAD-dependent oxidoreductase [Nocardioides marmorisolisilvae]RNL79184.1 4Fe-4S ferredoxin [Nocardioides marmorisolisilvae]
MPYVVTQSCCSDASCVIACPVNCIHPAPGEPGFAEAEMLYVDPKACVDCGACATACPVDALKPHTKLSADELPFIELNRLYYAENPHADRTPLAVIPKRRALPTDAIRVAVVGSGPAGLYAADELLKHPGVTVDVFDRLPTPYGLARAGVAPDHQHTKQVTKLFAAIEGQPGFRYRLGVEVGADISDTELAERYHGVIYAVGASSDKALGIEGEDLLGSVPATSVVGWYNGHPDHEDAFVDLGGERVVIVGNGNVALDVARVLTADPARLATTDIADLPLATLRGSRLSEVVVIGRRGPAEAAFTLPELVGLAGLTDVDVVVDDAGVGFDLATAKGRMLAEIAARPSTPGRRRIVLRFCVAPVRILGTESVTGVELERTRLEVVDGRTVAIGTGETEILEAQMVLRSVGYHGEPVAGLPFDDATGTVPNTEGRVEPGLYVAGWIKRGPTGFIGTNKSCSEETVAALFDDLSAGLLTEPDADAEELERWLAERVPAHIGLAGWQALDAEERRRGAEQGRPRVKLLDVEEMRTVATAGLPRARGRRSLPFTL